MLKTIRPRTLKATTAWMAFSAAGHPSFFLGVFSFAGQARAAYQDYFKHSLMDAGYRVSRVRITPITRTTARQITTDRSRPRARKKNHKTKTLGSAKG